MGIVINGQNDTIGPVDNSMSLLGTVSIGGTMTIEDFTNIDSVGLITARNGIDVTGGTVTITTGANSASPAGSGDNLVIKDSNGCGLSILSGNGNSQNIYLGSVSDNDAVRLEGFYNSGSPYLNIYTAGAERLRIDSSGRVLIATTTNRLGEALHVLGNGIVTSSAENTNMMIFGTFGGSDALVGSFNSIPLIFRTANTERLRIESNGYVKTNSEFWVGGASPVLRWRNSSNEYATARISSNDLYFEVANAERLRITSGGVFNFGHGTSINLHGSTTAGVNINGNGNSGQIIANASSNRPLILGRQSDYGPLIEFFQGSNTQEAEITIPAADTFAINTGGTERVRITSDGKFGINTTSPGSLLSVSGGTNDDSFIRMNNEEVGLYFGAWGTGSTYPRETTINGTRFDSGSSPFLRIGGQGGIKFCADLNNERMRITSGGKFGFNRSSPHYAMHLSPAVGETRIDLHMTNDTTGHNNTDGVQFGYQNSGGAYIWNFENTNIYFGTNNTEKFRITSDGKVGINDTSPERELNVRNRTSGTPNSTLRIHTDDGGTSASAYAQLEFKHGSDTSAWIWKQGANTSSYGGSSGMVYYQGHDSPHSFYTNGNNLRFQVQGGDGSCTVNTANAYGQLSIQQRNDLHPPLSIRHHDGSLYKEMGTVGPNDRNGTDASSGGTYLHVRVRTVWNDASMTMFRITGYYPYSDYTHSYVGMYRYPNNSYRTNPYGQVISNLKRGTIHSIYNEAASPGYLVFVCNWPTNYTGLLFEHIGAGAPYGNSMQNDIEIIDSLRSTGTSALTF